MTRHYSEELGASDTTPEEDLQSEKAALLVHLTAIHDYCRRVKRDHPETAEWMDEIQYLTGILPDTTSLDFDGTQ